MTFQIIQRHRQECKTPRELYLQLHREFNFDFDPCPYSEPYSKSAPKFDGLSIEWLERNYINPPYNNITAWLEKAKEEMKKGNSKINVFLLPVDTSTKWFHNYILGKAEIRFIKGRLKFTDNKPAPFASMICIFKK